jgi:hypothetical protein
MDPHTEAEEPWAAEEDTGAFHLSQQDLSQASVDASPSSSSSPSSGSRRRRSRRSIVLNLSSSQSSVDEEEVENAFASLEALLESQGNSQQQDSLSKLATAPEKNSPLPPAPRGPRRNDSETKEANDGRGALDNRREIEDESPLVSSNKNSTFLVAHAPLEHPVASPSTALVKQYAMKTPTGEPVDESSNNTIQLENRTMDTQELPEPERQSVRLQRKRPSCQASGPTTSRFQCRSTVSWPDTLSQQAGNQGNYLLAHSRRMAGNLQKKQQQQESSSSQPPVLSPRSRVVSSTQSGLVGSLPQRWVHANSQANLSRTFAHPRGTRPSERPVTTRRRLAPTLSQSTPAWRSQSRMPQPPPAAAPAMVPQTPSTATHPLYQPLRALSVLAGSPESQDAISEIPDAAPTDESSPEGNHSTRMWWMPSSSSTTAGPSPRSPRKSKSSKRGPLMSAYLTAKDRWQSDRLRLHNSGGQTTAEQSLSVFSHPVDDPRRKARSYTDVTILTTGQRSSGGYTCHGVFLHEHFVTGETASGCQAEVALCCFPHGQTTGQALRIYNSVVLPWSCDDLESGSNVRWIVLATQVYEACPRDDLLSMDDLVQSVSAFGNVVGSE